MVQDEDGNETDKLVEQLTDTHKRLRDSSSRSGMSAQDRTLLERQIARLEGSVADLTAHLCEKGVANIKKDSMFTVAYIKKDSMFTKVVAYIKKEGKSWAEYAWRELHGRTLRRSGKKNAEHTWIERR